MEKGTKFYTKDILSEYIEKLGFEVGDFTYGTPIIRWWGEKARLKIGRFCSIGSGVNLYLGGNHRTDWITTYPFPASPINQLWPEAADIKGHPATKGDIEIGNDVWLGNECVILSGVNIGDGAVVGGRSVVTKDIPPYTIVGGNPSKELSRRFSSEEIRMLLDLQWWYWDIPKIKNNLHTLCSGKIKELWENSK